MKTSTVTIEQLGLQRFTEAKLVRNGADDLAELFAGGGRSVLSITGFGTAARDETARAIRRVLPELDQDGQEAARRFLEELQCAPDELPPRLDCLPGDFRSLLYLFENLDNRRSVAIMKHRLGFDGGPRRGQRETVEALGVSDNAVNQADYKVSKLLKESDCYQYSLDWFLNTLKESGGLLCRKELEGLLDSSRPVEPGEVHSALRLLDRVHGYHSPWVYLGDWIVAKQVHDFCAALSLEGPRPPYRLRDLLPALTKETGHRPKTAHLSRYLREETGLTLDGKNEIVVGCSVPPGVRGWAACILFETAGPLEQNELIDRISEVGVTSVSKGTLWSVLRTDPRIVKVSLKPSVWAWLPHLEITELEIASLRDRAAECLTTRQDTTADIRDLHAKLTPTNRVVTPILLKWLLKDDERFWTAREKVGLKP